VAVVNAENRHVLDSVRSTHRHSATRQPVGRKDRS
jgi:hypothetical protein